VTRLFPGNQAVAAAGFQAGEIFRLTRRLPEALERYRRARTEFPRSIWAGRAALGAAYCFVQMDNARRALQDTQWVRQQFPGTPVAEEALALNTIIYRLYVRAPAQPPFAFSGRFVGAERADYREVVGLRVEPDGRLLLAHKAGVTVFDAKGAITRSVPANEPSTFFVDDKGRVVVVKGNVMVVERLETQTLSVTERDGRIRPVEEIPAVLPVANGERLVADAKEHAVLRVATDGKVLGTFAQVDALRLRRNSLGDVAILDRSSKSIHVVDQSGKALGRILQKGTGYEIAEPVDIAYDALDHLYVLDRARGAVLVFGPKNRFVASTAIPEKNAGSFSRGSALALDAVGRMFIFDDRAKRVQVYQ
jgi:hypothetical protein